MGLFPTYSLYEVGRFEWDICDDNLDIAIVWSHAEYVTDYHFIALEAYTYTPEGEETRNRRYGELGYSYHQGTEINRGFRSRPGGLSFHDIGVSPVFLTENGDALPDVLQMVGCKTAGSRWTGDLCREDRIRTVIACSDTLLHTHLIITEYPHLDPDTTFVPYEAVLPWVRMNGTSDYYDWHNASIRRNRTAPRAFSEPFDDGDFIYLWRTNPDRPLWQVNIADAESLALAPMMTGTNMVEWTQLPEYDPNECWGTNLPVWMTFSCPMYTPNPGYRVSGSGGAWVGCEAWESNGGIPDSKLTAKLASTFAMYGEVIVRGTFQWEPYLRSAEGDHPFWKPGLGNAGTDWEVPMTCMYTAPNYATAYGPCPAWKEDGKAVLWLEGVENGTQRHLVYGGTDRDNLHVVAEVPGAGQEFYRRDELVDVPGDIGYVKLVEEPDGSETRVQEVLGQEPPQHRGWEHQSGLVDLELNPARPGPHRFDLPETCPDWVFYGPSWLLDEVRSSEFERILREQYYDGDFVYLDAPDVEGWAITEYATQCKETFGRVPDFCIVGSGCDVPEYSQNLVSPWKEPGCPGCYFYDYQSGDATWGVLDPDWRTSGWMPEAFITRVSAWDVQSFWRYAAIATSYHDQAKQGLVPNRVLALLGDELEEGLDPGFVNEYWDDLLRPRIVDGWDCSVVELRDTQFPNYNYYLSHQTVADRLNGSAWPGTLYLWGVVSNFIRTPGYLVHTYQGSYPWDGSLLTQGLNHHFVVIAPTCGMGDIYQWTAWRPSLLEMFMFSSDGTAGMAAAQLCTRGGGEQDHRNYADIQSYWAQHTLNTFECHKKVLQTWALLYPEAYHYGMGISHFGLPMLWSRGATGMEEEHYDRLGLVRCSSPASGTARITYSLPPLPPAASAELRIIDPSGRFIRRLALACSHGTSTWDCRDDAGRPVGSGTYFLALMVNGHVFATNRVVLFE